MTSSRALSPSYSAVLTCELSGGERAERLLFVRLRARRVRELAVYRLGAWGALR